MSLENCTPQLRTPPSLEIQSQPEERQGPDRAIRMLVLEEIRAIVDEADRAGSILVVGRHAKRLRQTYPAAGFSVGRIIDEFIAEATRLKVPILIDRAR